MKVDIASSSVEKTDLTSASRGIASLYVSAHRSMRSAIEEDVEVEVGMERGVSPRPPAQSARVCTPTPIFFSTY